MNFKNEAIASKYQMTGEVDQTILISGRARLLSEVTDRTILDGMIARKSNLVAPKPEPASKAIVPKVQA